MYYNKKLIDDSYLLLISDETIISLTMLAKKMSIESNKKIEKFRHDMYEVFGKENIKKITNHRFAKYRLSKRKNYFVTEETKEKISKSNKKFFDDNPERRDFSRELMKKYCIPNSHTAEVNKKRVQSRKRNNVKWHTEETKLKISVAQKGVPKSEEMRRKYSIAKKGKPSNRRGFKHTIETKKKLSNITKQQWIDGIHKPTFQSKGQIELTNEIKSIGYTVVSEYLIDGVPFDIFIKELNLIIEFNGTFWHRDSRFYQLDEEVQKIHDRDEFKKNVAIKNGYNFKVVWQYDWETQNKNEIIRSLLND